MRNRIINSSPSVQTRCIAREYKTCCEEFLNIGIQAMKFTSKTSKQRPESKNKWRFCVALANALNKSEIFKEIAIFAR